MEVKEAKAADFASLIKEQVRSFVNPISEYKRIEISANMAITVH